MILLPKNGYIFVEAVEAEKIKSGIILTSTASEDEQLSQGSVVFTNSEEFKVGDLVLFNKLIPDDIELEIKGKTRKLWGLHESAIMSVIKDENN